ncbi:uncharacterized protein UV8b_01301 [Ustilaginoidea virens]|uniref:Transmembrane protein n=2 Tax=Ustilaginoidea virens TaxID=1159556 RepID=A0A8E5HKD2_USTVR|nr:uncharacterized protein UV8b_01301 [Ustilaginoidea virens]QUC17060.1 hypothetical protein UV8b_01301 [Ustilaginoidea virens]
MAETRAARARLRRTFRYPDDDDDLHRQPEAMDEQEQEALIDRLSAQNALQNTHFSRILLLVAILATLPYLPLLANSRHAVLAILSITSLLSTAYLLHKLPSAETGIAPLDAWTRSQDALAASSDMARQIRRLRGGLRCEKSPLELYLPYLNAVLVLMLVLMGLVIGNGGGSFAWVGEGNLPAIVYAVVLLAKFVMAEVDPERELAGLTYEYRGA